MEHLRTNPTILGLIAIFIWGSFTALLRSVSEQFGITLGPALLYSVAAIMLLWRQPVGSLHHFPKRYLFLGGALFASYEVLLSLAVAMAETRMQSIEISLINYLWPSFIVLFAIPINRVRLSWFALPAILLTFIGLLTALIGGSGHSFSTFLEHLKHNPKPYVMVFIAALLWGLYCNIAKKESKGANGVPIFFALVAILLWAKFFIGLINGYESIPLHPPLRALLELLLAGVLIGLSYTLWESGIQRGNMVLLATLSYFTPLLSILFSSFWLNVTPTLNFWIGAICVTVGSLLAFLAQRAPKKEEITE